jgi:hypothetical protein
MASSSSEVKLYGNTKERRQIDDLADLYSIIKATEALEAAYTRDAVTPDAYEAECKRLISQFKTTESALVSSGLISDVDSFMTEYAVDTPRARNRLLLRYNPHSLRASCHLPHTVTQCVTPFTTKMPPPLLPLANPLLYTVKTK